MNVVSSCLLLLDMCMCDLQCLQFFDRMLTGKVRWTLRRWPCEFRQSGSLFVQVCSSYALNFYFFCSCILIPLILRCLIYTLYLLVRMEQRLHLPCSTSLSRWWVTLRVYFTTRHIPGGIWWWTMEVMKDLFFAARLWVYFASLHLQYTFLSIIMCAKTPIVWFISFLRLWRLWLKR